MNAVRHLALIAALLWSGVAAALPVGPLPPLSRPAHGDRAALVCGPYRCLRRPFWRYGDGRGFFPAPRFGPPPPRRFGYRPFGLGRFGGFRRW